jgi:hypothetical protein
MNQSGASVLGACAAWVLSAVPFFVDASAFAGLSRAALAAVPWLAYAGLPRREREDGSSGIAFELALFAPALALGAWLDAAGGLARVDLYAITGGSVVCAGLSAFAARACARQPATRALYAIAWFTLVAGIPILRATLVLGGATLFGHGPAWLAAIARVSPLQWVLSCLPAEAAHEWPFAPIALLAALCLFALVAARRPATEAAA